MKAVLKKIINRNKFSSAFIIMALRFRLFYFIIFSLLPLNVYSQSDQELSQLLFDPVPFPVNIEESLYENPFNPVFSDVNQSIDTDASQNEISDATISLYDESIQSFESENGPYDARITQELIAQAASYRGRGELESALLAFERAAHITKINNGLFSSQQEDIFSEIIDTHLLNDDLSSASFQYERLFYLQKKIYNKDDSQYINILNDYAKWSLLAFNLRLGMKVSPDESGFAPIDRLSPNSSQIRFITNSLINAQNIYLELSQVIQDNSGLTDYRLLDIEKQLASTSYFFSSIAIIRNASSFSNPPPIQPRGPRSPFGIIPQETLEVTAYRLGLHALERRIQYIKGMENLPAETLGEALMDLADWYFVFKKAGHAFDTYKEAYTELVASNAPPEQIEKTFHPQVSVSLPAFVAPLYSRAYYGIPADTQLQYRGYIDIEYQGSRFGSPRKLSVLGSSENTDSDLQEHLLRKLKRAHFRPRFLAGEVIRNELIQVRYYYTF